MKKFYSFAALAILFASCSSTYNFVQVCKIQPVAGSLHIEKGDFGSIYKDANCEIQYLFWSQAGNAGFILNNISNEMLYLDLTKTFYIENGFAYNYSSDMHMRMTTSNSSEKGTTNTSGYTENLTGGGLQRADKTNIFPLDGYTKSNTSQVQEMEGFVASGESEVIAIPPHSKRFIQGYPLSNRIFLNCDLEHFPESSSIIEIAQEESPLVFSNYITYHMDNGKDIVVKNEFYISEIANYSEPEAYQYVLRDTLCQNMTNITEKNYKYQYPNKVYDRHFNGDSYDSFYNYYNVLSNNRLYKNSGPYLYYSSFYDGYITSEGGWIGSSNNSTFGTAGFHTY